jgi:polynucleotide 5'-kinase involved in rRNA processing
MAHGFKGFLSGVLYVQLAVFVALWGGSASAGPAEEALKIQAEWSALLLRIESKVQALKLQLSAAGVGYRTGDLDRLWRKVGPQARLQTRPLVIMLMGQHNSGKSTVLNLLIGATPKNQVTRISDIGGSTTMPVALLNSAFPGQGHVSLSLVDLKFKKLSRPTDASFKPFPKGNLSCYGRGAI